MKKGWEIKTLGEVCEILNGDRGKNYPAKRKLHDSGEYPFISAINFKNKTINIEGLLYLDESQYNALSQGKLKKNDVVLCIRGSLGKNCIFPFDKGAIASSLVILRAQKRVDFNFLSKYLDTNSFFEQIEQQSNGAAQPNLGANKLKTFKIILPPLSEQRRIVEVLDREFERIDTIRKNAETSLQYAKDLMQAKLKEELQYKEGWEKKNISLIATLKAGKFVSAKDISKVCGENMYPCFGGNGLRGYVKSFNYEGRYNIIGRQGALCGNINIADGKFHATEHAVVVTPIIEIEFRYLYFSLVNANLNQFSTGVAQPGLSVENLNAKVELNIPPFSEQQQIVSRLDRYSEACRQIEENSRAIISHCDALKQALLRKAFDGELLS